MNKLNDNNRNLDCSVMPILKDCKKLLLMYLFIVFSLDDIENLNRFKHDFLIIVAIE